ncbi:MAG: choline-sulfatase [Candidatus Lokiarchaeota archaeon]|nr:choline-sulfatase [Candidatus Lokiarchaeota archaeon]
MKIEKPNILIILSDQMAPQLVGAYGRNVSKTPNLKSLCEQGVRFDAAYCNSPICAPSRASMITGKFISEIGTYDNGVNFPADIPTFLHFLRLQGYEVVASGKMHYLGPDQLHGLETRLTQDIYPANYKWIHDWEEGRKSGIKNDKGHLVSQKNTGCRSWSTQMNYDEETHNRALEYLRRRVYTKDSPKNEQEKPFCLIVSYTQPHSPYITIDKYWELYQDANISPPKITQGYADSEIIMDKWLRNYEGIPKELMNNTKVLKTLRRAYYGMISYIDEKVGDLVEALERLGFRDNTAIIFAADHGDMVGERGFIEKRVFYEYSSRIPMIWSWPKKWQQGATVSDPVSLIDIFPTLVDLTNGEYPFQLSGKSLLNLLLESTADKAVDRIVISEYHGEGVLKPCFMIRKNQYKYIYVHGHSSQLFDLNEDPDELSNLSGDSNYKKIEEALKDIILERFDCNTIERSVISKQQRCIYIYKAMMSGKKTYWDIRPDPNQDLKYDQK